MTIAAMALVDADLPALYRATDRNSLDAERRFLRSLQNQGEPTGWIPIREEDSPAAPFDFSGERIPHVPCAGSRVNEQWFPVLLTRRIDTLLLQT